MHRLAPTAATAALCALSAALLQSATAAPAGPSAAGTGPDVPTYVGTYQRAAVHAPVDGHAHHHTPSDQAVVDLLVVGSRAYRITLPLGRRLTPGATVRVRGTVSGTTLAAIDATTTTEPTSAATTTGAAAAQTSVLVILASWSGPDSVTRESAVAQVLGDGDSWRREVSNGAKGFSGTVTPWLSIAGPTGGLCFTNHRETMTQAKAAALLAGFDPTAYHRVVLYHPKGTNADCSGYGGWAYQPGTEVWLNGEMTRRAAMHELGHSDGLWHAGSIKCTAGGLYVALTAAGCTVVDYGDLTDAMGSSGFGGHFSVVHKQRLGWLGSRAVALEPGGTTVLAPAESAGTAVIAASVTTASGRRYWLETRAATGADAALPPGVLNGLLVRVDDPTLSTSPLLLDLTPDGLHTNAALPAGASWTSPEGIVLSTSAVPGGLSVAVSAVTAPVAPAALAAVPGDDSATVTWSAPVSDGGAAVASYAVVVGPTTMTVGPTSRSAVVTGLVNGTTYPVSVAAVNTAGRGTPATTSVTPADRVAPASPTAVSVTVRVPNATVAWTNPIAADLAGIVVRMKTGSLPPTSVTDGTAVYSGLSTSATVSGLVRGVTYSFAVFARDEVPNWSAGASPAVRTRK